MSSRTVNETTMRLDGGPPTQGSRPPMPEAIDGNLRRGLRAAAQGSDLHGELRAAVESACAAARADGMPAEHLIILTKECWREMPESRRHGGLDADAIIARVITMCITEYYAPYRRR